MGTLDPQELRWLKAEKAIEPRSADISVREGLIKGTKQARHEKSGDGLLPQEWRRLPEIIENPDQVLFDTRSGKLVYVKSAADAGIKIAVELDHRVGTTGRINRVVSGFRQSASTLEQMIRGGTYEVVR